MRHLLLPCVCAASAVAFQQQGLAPRPRCAAWDGRSRRSSVILGVGTPDDQKISRTEVLIGASTVGLGIAMPGIASAAPLVLERSKLPESHPRSSPRRVEEETARREVLDATDRWLASVTSGDSGAPERTAALYAADGVLWGTLSEELRVTHTEIQDYFEYFARLPKLRVSTYKPYVRIFGECATNDGYYVFQFEDSVGQIREKKARFSFVYRRTPAGQWLIETHHSSALPQAPAFLEPARTVVLD